MEGWEIKQPYYGQGSFSPEPQPYAPRPETRWAVWLFLSGFARVQPAWAARGTTFRGQWSLGSLIGSLVIIGILAALIVFFIWPRQGGQ